MLEELPGGLESPMEPLLRKAELTGATVTKNLQNFMALKLQNFISHTTNTVGLWLAVYCSPLGIQANRVASIFIVFPEGKAMCEYHLLST